MHNILYNSDNFGNSDNLNLINFFLTFSFDKSVQTIKCLVHNMRGIVI